MDEHKEHAHKHEPHKHEKHGHSHEHKEHEHKEHHTHHKPHVHHRKKSFYEKNKDNLFFALSFILVVIIIANVIITSGYKKQISALPEGPVVEAAGKITLTTLLDQQCTNCFDIKEKQANAKQGNVEVTKETELDYRSPEAQKLIEKYNVKRIPAIIITGDVDKSTASEFVQVSDALVFVAPFPPYFDVAENKMKGNVEAVLITNKACEECADLSAFIKQIRDGGVGVTAEKVLDITEAQDMITKYKLEKVPIIVFSSDLGDYPQLEATWNEVGTIEEDGKYVLRQVIPPYYDLVEKKVVGLVTMTMLGDVSCEGCYDVEIHKQIMGQFGVALEETNLVDIASTEGKTLLTKYNITAVPTVILEGDLDVYERLKPVWNQVGSVEADGTWVFRNLAALKNAPYKDLTTGEMAQTS